MPRPRHSRGPPRPLKRGMAAAWAGAGVTAQGTLDPTATVHSSSLSPPLSSQTKVSNQRLRIAKENVSLGKETALGEADQMSRARSLLCVYQGLSFSHRAKASWDSDSHCPSLCCSPASTFSPVQEPFSQLRIKGWDLTITVTWQSRCQGSGMAAEVLPNRPLW